MLLVHVREAGLWLELLRSITINTITNVRRNTKTWYEHIFLIIDIARATFSLGLWERLPFLCAGHG